jgi:hypothetical protein
MQVFDVCLMSKAKITKIGQLLMVYLPGQASSCISKYFTTEKSLPQTNTAAHFPTESAAKKHFFITLTPGKHQ